MTSLAPSFFIESSSFLQETRICMKAWMNINLGKIPLVRELSALEHLIFFYKVVNNLAPSLLNHVSR